jgi:hypothetical protein
VVVPVETGYFSLHGLAKMMETLEVMKDRCGREILIRVLPTLYDTRTKLAREVLSELRAKFRDYLMESTVNFNTKLKEAASFGQPITEYDPGSRGYKDFVNLARELMGHRPVDLEPTPTETLSRPAELVQRAKQLAQLANFQFGRTNIAQMPTSSPVIPPATPFANPVSIPTAPESRPFIRPEPVRNEASINRVSEMGLNLTEDSEPNIEPVSEDRIFGNEPYTGPKLGEQNSGGVALASAPVAAIPRLNLQIEPPVEPIAPRKTTPLPGVRQVGDQTVFTTRLTDARKVLIAGDFNNWSPMSTPMTSGEHPGIWTARLPLYPGRYRYRLIVDGKWMTDPGNTYVESNQFGELNNIVEVA